MARKTITLYKGQKDSEIQITMDWDKPIKLFNLKIIKETTKTFSSKIYVTYNIYIKCNKCSFKGHYKALGDIQKNYNFLKDKPRKKKSDKLIIECPDCNESRLITYFKFNKVYNCNHEEISSLINKPYHYICINCLNKKAKHFNRFLEYRTQALSKLKSGQATLCFRYNIRYVPLGDTFRDNIKNITKYFHANDIEHAINSVEQLILNFPFRKFDLKIVLDVKIYQVILNEASDHRFKDLPNSCNYEQEIYKKTINE